MIIKNEIFFPGLILFAFALFVLFACKKSDEITNQAPLCKIVWPVHGDEFLQGEFIFVNVKAEDNDDTITEVRYYVDGVEFGSLTTYPYQFYWDSNDTNLSAAQIIRLLESSYCYHVNDVFKLLKKNIEYPIMNIEY